MIAALALPLGSRECGTGQARNAPAVVASVAPRAPAVDPVRIETLAGSTPPIFVLRGGPVGPEKLVFLHGMCGHGLGYAQSFEHSAARRGMLIAPQADVPCGSGPFARWSKDIAALDQRITTAFRELGYAEPIEDIVVIGYSQGATRAEALAREYPTRYTRLVLMGGAVCCQSARPRATPGRRGDGRRTGSEGFDAGERSFAG